MPPRIFNGSDSYDYYQMTLDWINAQYDQYPTSIIPIPISEQEAADQSYYDALGRYCAEEAAAADEWEQDRQVRQLVDSLTPRQRRTLIALLKKR